MTPKNQYYENLAASIIKNLEKRQMAGYYCPNKEEALKKVLELIPEESCISWGGSESLEEAGILQAVRKGTYHVLDRSKATTPEEIRQVFLNSFNCDYYLMSTNAITHTGELVNVDGRSNRVAALCYGPKHVIIVAGMNKVVKDVDNGLARVRNAAAPPNCLRLKKNTPCAATGFCSDCLSPDCICNQTVITRRSGIPGRIIVILVGEELGY